MSYEKRLCILKQIRKGFSADGGPLSGAVYAERLGGELILTPRVTGIAPVREGRYALAVWAGGETYCLELKGGQQLRIPSAPSIQEGFSVLVCYVRNAGEPEPVVYGYCGAAPATYERLLPVFEAGGTGKKSKRKNMPPMPLSPFEQPAPASPQLPRAPTPPLPGEDDEPFRDSVVSADAVGQEREDDEPFRGGAAESAPPRNKYDDEAIAEEDYFGKRLCENDENEVAPVCGQGETAASADGYHAGGNVEDDSVSPIRLNRGGLTYYNQIKDKLDSAMKKFPRDERLNAAFPHSEWVKTPEGMLGVIYAEGLPRYLCVATEGTPPPEMLQNGVYVPCSEFSDEEIFVVFQDAETGEYVKTSDA